MKRYKAVKWTGSQSNIFKWAVLEGKFMYTRHYSKKNAIEEAKRLNHIAAQENLESEMREAGVMFDPSEEGRLSRYELREIEERMEEIRENSDISDRFEYADLKAQLERSYKKARIREIGFRIILGGAA